MYTELNETVNFVSRHMMFRIPRLKLCLFAEHMSNIMLLRYYGKWDPMDPKTYKEYRILRISNGMSPDDIVFSAASAVGLCVEEIMLCFPDRMIIFVNPGEVCYIEGDGTMPKPIWVGSAESADDKYTPGSHVRLSLVHPRELGIDNPFPNSSKDFRMFRYVIPGTQNFTVESFSQTRFGSLRKRPDPEQLRRLQKSILASGSAPHNVPPTPSEIAKYGSYF
ncbi:BTG family domain-containing protein [Ditylenchus destructor]|uniref:BTG family domain-containing protein n=1 Tax=Ditylenchus destructor TaxID=166010 RepID=A0AAD4RDB7_9BILA|nr:BTG family domain-containing protein [Ditylenchus destructor]